MMLLLLLIETVRLLIRLVYIYPDLGIKNFAQIVFSDIGKQIEAKSVRVRDKIDEFDNLIFNDPVVEIGIF